jgi:hypothetical protein
VAYSDFESELTAMPGGETQSGMLGRLLGDSVPPEPASYWEIELPPAFAA